MNDNFNPSCAKVVEAGQIGYRLAEEVMSLRKELLALKENKRTLLISNQNLEGDLLSSRKIILSLQSQLSKDHIELSKKTSKIKILEDELIKLKEIKYKYNNKLSVGKNTCKRLVTELENSLEDEITLRNYCRKLELDVDSASSQMVNLHKSIAGFCAEKAKFDQYVAKSSRINLQLLKKMDLIMHQSELAVISDAEYAILNSNHICCPDYSSSHPCGIDRIWETANNSGSEDIINWNKLDEELGSVEQRGYRMLNLIRKNITKLKKRYSCSQKYLKKLLGVVHTYEDLLPKYTIDRDNFHYMSTDESEEDIL